MNLEGNFSAKKRRCLILSATFLAGRKNPGGDEKGYPLKSLKEIFYKLHPSFFPARTQSKTLPEKKKNPFYNPFAEAFAEVLAEEKNVPRVDPVESDWAECLSFLSDPGRNEGAFEMIDDNLVKIGDFAKKFPGPNEAELLPNGLLAELRKYFGLEELKKMEYFKSPREYSEAAGFSGSMTSRNVQAHLDTAKALGLRPDLDLLKTLSGKLIPGESCEPLHAELSGADVAPDEEIIALLLEKARNSEERRRTLKIMAEADLTLTTEIAERAVTHFRRRDLAERVYLQLKEHGLADPGKIPAYLISLSEDWERALPHFEELRAANGLTPAGLEAMLSKAGNRNQVETVANATTESHFPFTAKLYLAKTRHASNAAEVRAVIEEMREARFEPSAQAYNHLLRHAESEEAARGILIEMENLNLGRDQNTRLALIRSTADWEAAKFIIREFGDRGETFNTAAFNAALHKTRSRDQFRELITLAPFFQINPEKLNYRVFYRKAPLSEYGKLYRLQLDAGLTPSYDDLAILVKHSRKAFFSLRWVAELLAWGLRPKEDLYEIVEKKAGDDEPSFDQSWADLMNAFSDVARTGKRNASATTTPSFFLSYSHANKDTAYRLAEALKARGCPVFFDMNSEKHKDSVEKFLARKPRNPFMLCLVDDNYLKSPFCMIELFRAFKQQKIRKRVIPITLGASLRESLSEERIRFWTEAWDEIKETLIRESREEEIQPGLPLSTAKQRKLYFAETFRRSLPKNLGNLASERCVRLNLENERWAEKAVNELASITKSFPDDEARGHRVNPTRNPHRRNHRPKD